jgi:transposase
MTHDHKRNGTTRLFAALNTLDGTVVGRCMPRHTHKHPKVLEWLADHPRWAFHFTPTSASWINAVEGFFSAITRRRIVPIRSGPRLQRSSGLGLLTASDRG